MKKKIRKTLQMLEPRPMPDKETVLAACPTVPVPQESAHVRHRFSPAKVAALAMVALLTVGGGVGVVAETMAYNEAIDFFEEYNLSAEGFTRSEVKKIYKDIVSESFTYEKTEEALASGLEGYEIQAQPLDSEGLKRVWMVSYWLGNGGNYIPVSDQYEYRLNKKDYVNSEGWTYEIQQIKDGKVQWSKDFSDSIVAYGNVGVQKIGDKAAIAGYVPYDSEVNRDYTIRLGLINADSTMAWVKDYACPYFDSRVEYLLCEDDTITVFVMDDTPGIQGGLFNTVYIFTVDLEGNRISEEFVQGFYEFCFFGDAVRVGPDEYLMTNDYFGLLKKTGNTIEKLQEFEDGDWLFEFTNMVKFNGLVYISGTRHPRYFGSESGNDYDQFVADHEQDGITDEEAEKFYKENHSAVLMVLDPKTGERLSFYTLPGASGGELKVEGDRMTWMVNRYTDIKSMYVRNYYLSAGVIAEISADKWQYVFNPYGQLVGEKDTGMSVKFEG